MKRTVYNCVCGGKARSETEPLDESFMFTHKAFVRCRKCGARGPEVNTFRDHEAQARAKWEAVEKWNKNSLRAGVRDFTTYTDCILPPFAQPATDKQVKYAEAIADRLGFKLPREKSKEEYRKFISEHVAEFKAKKPKSCYADGGDWPVDDSDWYEASVICENM